MFHAEQLHEHTWRGVVFSVGQRVEYSARNCTALEYSLARPAPRLEATVVELWLEWWENGQTHLLYAECLTDDGNAQRLWFHRDDVQHPSGFVEHAAGQVAGALW
ncbi:hypothetical protein [Microbacterium allomyrinae]|uniref:Uncharacterized protein n=1 Tax=Microbacterium allomyrinae TaxID=2830666 RepID=A0A9X1S5D8_9MICO|nr:hypothetical protein [Microbacterium allomyrinae]MCC2034123.1 hypothetical protein [Microbacterium allomyrinae]